MDFTLALTHFCEVHGPKSVLCTQVLPLECALCLPPSPPLRPQRSSESLSTQVPDSTDEHLPPRNTLLQKTDTNLTLPTDFSGASTAIDSEPDSPTIEKHPLFKINPQAQGFSPQYRYGRAQGDLCASCTFTLPQNVADKLPPGAPGSLKNDGKDKNGAPVLRSREFVCLGRPESPRRKHPGNSQASSSESSFRSISSNYSHGDCHDHTLTYLTAKSPDDPERFALLRASVIRTLSCELLPRGMSDGPFSFGDPSTGYTIAYIFRLTDPKARGRRRAYAFIALAGKDASRAFRASPMIWEAFATMARGIEQAAQRHQDEQSRKEEEELASGRRDYTPVSSFLSHRTVDPDGQLRRTGHPTSRNLAEIVGDENIFVKLHKDFVLMLKALGERFGGLPLADKPSVYHTTVAEHDSSEDQSASKGRTQLTEQYDKLRDDDRTPTPRVPVPKEELDVNKARNNRPMNIGSSCGLLSVGEAAHPQVVM